MKKEKILFIFGGTVAAMALSSLFHFINEWLGNPAVTAGLFPINESVWEHMKLPFYSMLPVTLIPWCRYLKSTALSVRLQAFALGSLLAILVLLGGYYCLDSGFLISGLWVDLILLAAGIFLGLYHGCRLFEKAERLAGTGRILRKEERTYCPWGTLVSLLYLLGMIVLFYRLSFYPPGFPVFSPPV